jgi:hypothetical protein
VNARAPSDLVRQMWLLIAEEAPLWELTQQVTDYYGGERTLAHGPWQAADCQQVLGRWFDCGLIDCIAVSWATKARSDEVVRYEYDADWRTRATENGQHLVLARDDAGGLLKDPSAWRADGIGAGVMLCESDQAAGCRSTPGSTSSPDCRTIWFTSSRWTEYLTVRRGTP